MLYLYLTFWRWIQSRWNWNRYCSHYVHGGSNWLGWCTEWYNRFLTTPFSVPKQSDHLIAHRFYWRWAIFMHFPAEPDAVYGCQQCDDALPDHSLQHGSAEFPGTGSGLDGGQGLCCQQAATQQVAMNMCTSFSRPGCCYPRELRAVRCACW